MKRKLVCVLGLGLFGSSVAKSLARNGMDVIAMDLSMDHVEEVMDEVDLAIQGDFTKFDQLEAVGVADVDAAVIAAGERLEVAILAIMNLKKLGVENVIVKTKNEDYKEVLLKVGASRVILPEVEIGIRLGNELSSSNIVDFLELDDDYHILELEVEEEWIGKSIIELDIRNKYGYNIIAISPKHLNKYQVSFNPDYKFEKHDKILVFSENKSINEKLVM